MNGIAWKTFTRLASAALAVALAGCGVSPGPDLSGPEGNAYMTAYSGSWVLLRLESDDLEAEFNEAMAGRPGATAGGVPGAGSPGGRGGGMTGRRPGGGMTGGRAGGGRMPGGMPGSGGGMDPEEMRRVMEATMTIARTPRELGLTLRPESVTLAQKEGPSQRLDFGGDEISVGREGAEYFATAEWTEEGLIIERKVDRGGRVRDEMKLDAEGRLVVKREIDALRGGKVKGTLVYRRGEG